MIKKRLTLGIYGEGHRRNNCVDGNKNAEEAASAGKWRCSGVVVEVAWNGVIHGQFLITKNHDNLYGNALIGMKISKSHTRAHANAPLCTKPEWR